jgi:hypothetical protein
MTTINIPSDIKYLSQYITELPSNCIFDKGKVGCGGTTLAIQSNKPYVIAVPFVSLIENKAKQHSNVFPVYEGVKVKHIEKYISETETPIIMTTYDSLEKVVEGLADQVNTYTLLVDEYHLLFTQYSFREAAIHKVLDNYTKFSDYCFMTATVLEEEFILEELKDVDLVTAVWESVADVKVHSVHCPKGVLGSTVDLLNRFLSGEEEGNAYIFVNSVAFIKEVLANIPELNIENCNVVYSKGNKTKLGIGRGTLPSSVGVEPKKINLLTSTVFEGSDIYDEEGKTYIISDATKAHTLVDISTSFQQIAGRIRNSKYITEITHFFTFTRYNGLTYNQFKEKSEEDIKLTKSAVEEFNTLSDYARGLIQSKVNETYLSDVDGKFIFNANLVKLDIYNFKVCKHLYSLRVNVLENEFSKYGYDVETSRDVTTTVLISTEDLEGFEITVKALEVIAAKHLRSLEDIAFREAAYMKYTFLESAIEKLGFKGIEEESYKQTNIKRKLVSMLDVNQETKIFKLLKTYNDMSAGNFISSKVLKNRLNDIYNQLGLDKKAKGSDIENFFSVKNQKKKIKNVTTDGYIIYTPKYFINNN